PDAVAARVKLLILAVLAALEGHRSVLDKLAGHVDCALQVATRVTAQIKDESLGAFALQVVDGVDHFVLAFLAEDRQPYVAYVTFLYARDHTRQLNGIADDIKLQRVVLAGSLDRDMNGGAFRPSDKCDD